MRVTIPESYGYPAIQLKLGEPKVPTPKHFCNSCNKCTFNYCNFYERPVNAKNKCFNHQFYRPDSTLKYVEPDRGQVLRWWREKEEQMKADQLSGRNIGFI